MAFDNLSSFDAALSGEGDRLGNGVLLLHKKLHLEAAAGVIVATPVDEGTARRNWNSSVGFPDTSTTAETANRRGEPGGDEVMRAVSGIAALKPYGISYLTNALPYIEALENGSSRQAPAGMLTPMVARLGLDVLEVSP